MDPGRCDGRCESGEEGGSDVGGQVVLGARCGDDVDVVYSAVGSANGGVGNACEGPYEGFGLADEVGGSRGPLWVCVHVLTSSLGSSRSRGRRASARPTTRRRRRGAPEDVVRKV